MRSEPCIRCGMPMRRGTYCLRCEKIIEAQRAAKADPRAAGVEAYRLALTGEGPIVDAPAPRFT